VTEVVFEVRVLREHTNRFAKLWAAGWANRATGRADSAHFVPMQIIHTVEPDADLKAVATELTALLTQCRISFVIGNSGQIQQSRRR
jgi:hypothetical protein